MRNSINNYRNREDMPYQRSTGIGENQDYLNRPLQTLYRTQTDLMRALNLTIELLKGNLPGKDSEGFLSVDSVCDLVRQKECTLGYINKNHIIELFFKDKDRKILVSGEDRIKYKEVKYVQPPETLYFGTITGLVGRMMNFGIKSSTKGYIKLYMSKEMAADFGKKFATMEKDTVTVIEVDALKAFSEGLKFSTYKEGEYVVIKLDKRYLKGPIDTTGAVEIPDLPDDHGVSDVIL